MTIFTLQGPFKVQHTENIYNESIMMLDLQKLTESLSRPVNANQYNTILELHSSELHVLSQLGFCEIF